MFGWGAGASGERRRLRKRREAPSSPITRVPHVSLSVIRLVSPQFVFSYLWMVGLIQSCHDYVLYWLYMLKLFMTRTNITSWMLYAHHSEEVFLLRLAFLGYFSSIIRYHHCLGEQITNAWKAVSALMLENIWLKITSLLVTWLKASR